MKQLVATPPWLSKIDSIRQDGIQGFVRGLGWRSTLEVVDIDPQAYAPHSAKQTSIDDADTIEKKQNIDKVIAKWFNFHGIQAQIAQGSYFQSMVSLIEKVATGIQSTTLKEITMFI